MNECKEHDWSFEENDYCPVCHGIETMRRRILRVIDLDLVLEHLSMPSAVITRIRDLVKEA